MDKRSYSTAEAACYIGMSEEFLRRARINGPSTNGAPSPKFIKLGRCVRYIKNDLDGFLDCQVKYHSLAEIN